MPRDRKRVDVLVLGAGAAGLAAARDLSHAGLRVTVVEGRPRVGGRILTLHDPRSPVPVLAVSATIGRWPGKGSFRIARIVS